MGKSIISIGYRDFNPDLVSVERFQKPILSFIQNQFLDYYVISTSFFCDFQIPIIFQPFSPHSPISGDFVQSKFKYQFLTSFFYVNSEKSKSYFVRLFRFSARFSRSYTVYMINRITKSLVLITNVKKVVNYMFKFPQLKFCINQFSIIKSSIFNKYKLFKFRVNPISILQIFDSKVPKGLFNNFIKYRKTKWPFFSVIDRMVFKFFNTRRTRRSKGLAIIARTSLTEIGYSFHHMSWKYVSSNLSKVLRQKLSKKSWFRYRNWIKFYYKALYNGNFSKHKTWGFIKRELKRNATIWWYKPRPTRWEEVTFKVLVERKRLQNRSLQFFQPIPKTTIYAKIISTYLRISNFNEIFTTYSVYFRKLRDSTQISKVFINFNKLKFLFQHNSQNKTLQKLKYIFSRLHNSFISYSNYQLPKIVLSKIHCLVSQTRVANTLKLLNRFLILHYFGVKFRIPQFNLKFSLVNFRLVNSIVKKVVLPVRDFAIVFSHLGNSSLIFKNKNYKDFIRNSHLVINDYIFQIDQQPYTVYITIRKNFSSGGKTPWGYYVLLSSSPMKGALEERF